MIHIMLLNDYWMTLCR